MKKVLLFLIATVMFGVAGNAQNGSFSKSAMTVIVANAKETFTRGMDYKEWLVSQIGSDVTPTKEEDKFLSDVFGFLSSGANSETILKSYDGKSFLDVALLNSKGGLKALSEGNTNSQNKWCVICLIKLLVDLVCQVVDCTGPVIPVNP